MKICDLVRELEHLKSIHGDVDIILEAEGMDVEGCVIKRLSTIRKIKVGLVVNGVRKFILSSCS